MTRFQVPEGSEGRDIQAKGLNPAQRQLKLNTGEKTLATLTSAARLLKELEGSAFTVRRVEGMEEQCEEKQRQWASRKNMLVF